MNGTLSIEQLSELLSRALGEDKAMAELRKSVAFLDLDEHQINLVHAQAILGHIATAPGIVGISARFAKARLHLLNPVEVSDGDPDAQDVVEA